MDVATTQTLKAVHKKKESRKTKNIYLLNQVYNLSASEQQHLFPCTPTGGKEGEN